MSSAMDVDDPGKSISLFTHKGGVGKTFTTINLAFHLAINKKKRVLIIDLDPQMNTTQSLLSDEEWNSHINWLDDSLKRTPETYDCWLSFVKNESFNNINPSRVSDIKLTENNHLNDIKSELFLIKGSYEYIQFNNFLSMNLIQRQQTYPRMIKTFLDTCKGKFDYVIIDLNPSFSDLNKVFLQYSDYTLCPMTPDSFCALTPKLIKWNINSEERFRNIKFLGYFINLAKKAKGTYSHVCLEIKDKIDVGSYQNDLNLPFLGYFPNMQSFYAKLQIARLNLVTAMKTLDIVYKWDEVNDNGEVRAQYLSNHNEQITGYYSDFIAIADRIYHIINN